MAAFVTWLICALHDVYYLNVVLNLKPFKIYSRFALLHAFISHCTARALITVLLRGWIVYSSFIAKVNFLGLLKRRALKITQALVIATLFFRAGLSIRGNAALLHKTSSYHSPLAQSSAYFEGGDFALKNHQVFCHQGRLVPAPADH